MTSSASNHQSYIPTALLTYLPYIPLIGTYLQKVLQQYYQYISIAKGDGGPLFYVVHRVSEVLGLADAQYLKRKTSSDSSRLHKHFTSSDSNTTEGYLQQNKIPVNPSPPSSVLRGLPQREASRDVPAEWLDKQMTWIKSEVLPKYDGQLKWSKSNLEDGDALFLTSCATLSHPIFREIGHCHHNEHSWHLLMHPDDANLLIERHYAERFTFSGTMLPISFVFVYCVRDQQSFDVWQQAVIAAIDYNIARYVKPHKSKKQQ